MRFTIVLAYIFSIVCVEAKAEFLQTPSFFFGGGRRSQLIRSSFPLAPYNMQQGQPMGDNFFGNSPQIAGNNAGIIYDGGANNHAIQDNVRQRPVNYGRFPPKPNQTRDHEKQYLEEQDNDDDDDTDIDDPNNDEDNGSNSGHSDDSWNLTRVAPKNTSNPGYIPPQNDIPMLRDTLSQQPGNTPPVAFANGRQVRLAELDSVMTATHEACHGTNSLYSQQGSQALYDPYKGTILVPESGITRTTVASKIPQGLRGSRFTTYIQSQNGGPPMAGTPMINGQAVRDADLTYLWDEWACYRVGALAGIEAMNKGMNLRDDDLFAGVMEFTLYAAATLQTAHERGSNAFNQMREAFGYLASTAMDAVRKGEQLNPSNNNWTATWWQKLGSNEAAPLMNFLSQQYGSDWVQRHFTKNGGGGNSMAQESNYRARTF